MLEASEVRVLSEVRGLSACCSSTGVGPAFSLTFRAVADEAVRAVTGVTSWGLAILTSRVASSALAFS